MNTPRNTDAHANGHENAAPAVERLERVLHELRSLLDASRTLVDHAKKGLGSHATTLASGGAADVERDLTATSQRLDRMADLVHAAMQNANKPIGSPALSRARPVTLAEAVQHAINVLTPMANAHQVRLSATGGPLMEALPAGALYTVVLNGLQNAVEAVAARSGPGSVSLILRPDSAPTSNGYGRDGRDWFVLEITDDGIGPPQSTSRCFDLGFSTKPRGAGVGLAVARSVVQGMGGTIELTPRPQTGGALLRVRFPSLANTSALTLGGAA